MRFRPSTFASGFRLASILTIPSAACSNLFFYFDNAMEGSTLGIAADHVKAFFRRARCGFSHRRPAGHASILTRCIPVEAVDGQSVIFSIPARETASSRAFFRDVDACG
jgi:hypothetical protein